MKFSARFQSIALLAIVAAYVAMYVYARQTAGSDPSHGLNGLWPTLVLTYVAIPLVSLALGVLGGLVAWPWPWWIATAAANSLACLITLWVFFKIDRVVPTMGWSWFATYVTFTFALAVVARLLVGGARILIGRLRDNVL